MSVAGSQEDAADVRLRVTEQSSFQEYHYVFELPQHEIGLGQKMQIYARVMGIVAHRLVELIDGVLLLSCIVESPSEHHVSERVIWVENNACFRLPDRAIVLLPPQMRDAQSHARGGIRSVQRNSHLGEF